MISNTTRLGTSNNSDINTKKNNNPKFKGIGSAALNATGNAMNWIENGGFVTSFLIQDTLGMTVPRTREGLYRDRDKKVKFKDMNFKEAGEVFIREFLSGPLMMFTPFIVFALTKKFMGKSTFNNTGLVKKMGKNFTDVIKNKKSGETVKGLKENFYRNTLHQMVEHTTPNATGKNEFVEKIFNNVSKLDELEAQLPNAKGKTFGQKLSNIFKSKSNKFKSEKDILKEQIAETKGNILKEFNEYHTTHSNELGLVNKIRINNDTYSAAESIDSMRNYAFDAIKGNDITQISEDTAKNLEKKTMAKRIFSTVAASLATIGSTSIVPAIYTILNPVAPGAMDNGCYNPDHEHMPTNKTQNIQKPDNNKTTDKKGNVQFKGNVLRQLQFDGNQLTPLLMTTLAAGGLIVPRVRTAVKRAPIDEDGKKNLIEVPEILTRDIISTTAVTFGVPILSKAMVNTYEDASGFVLKNNKPNEKMSTFKKIIDTINPLSSIEPFNNKDLKEIYGNIDSKAKLTNFVQFIDEKGGDLAKVFKSLKNGKESFAGTVGDFDSLTNAKLDRKASNAKIMEAITNHFDENMVKKLMEPAKAGKPNGMFIKARNLNSLPKFLNTIVLVPVFLGVVLPKIVYGITAKNRKKLEEARLAKMQQKQTQQQKAQPVTNIQKTQLTGQVTFNKLKHNK